ncbi:unnamed protein product, partial [Hymenolepis diminuta]
KSLAFPELLFIRILYDCTSVFPPQSWNNVFYVPMTRNPYLSCQTRPSISSFFNHLVSSKKCICPHVLARPYPSDLYKAIFVFHSIKTHACQLPALRFLLISSLQHAPLSISPPLASILDAASLSTFCSN